jgi:hypothetical protein
MSSICDRYKVEVVDPWIRSLGQEGERRVIGLIEKGSKMAKALFTSSPEADGGQQELDARQTQGDYDTTKRSYHQVRAQFQAVLDTWRREEHRQILENRQLLERASEMISQKAYGFIDQAIEKTLQDWRLGDIHSEDGHIGRGPSAGEKWVNMLGYSAWTGYAEPVAYRASKF